MFKQADIIVFDFDGTLSRGDANIAFGKYCLMHSFRTWIFLPLILIGAVAKLFNPGGIWWRETMRSFLTRDMVKNLAPNFIKLHKRARFDWAKSTVKREKENGNIVILISAGPDFLIPDLVRDLGFDAVMCSKMNSTKPYKFEFLCWNKNKVLAMDNFAKQEKIFPRIFRSYSDSLADMPIMELSLHRVWVNPKTGARRANY